jgi:VWFA-related protein
MSFIRFRSAIEALCLGAGLCMLVLSISAQAQQAASAQEQQAAPAPTQPSQSAPTISVTTHEVLLDVTVTDRSGNPVTGLTASDFKVMEEGDAQGLTHIEEHQPMSAAVQAPAPLLPPNTFTNFTPVRNTNSSTVILLDAMDMQIQTQMELREQLIDCLKHLQPGSPVAIFEVDTEMRLIQGFTADPQLLWAAATSKRNMPSLQKPVYGTREEYRHARLDILRGGFQMMGRYLAGFPGRKNLVWLTGSIPAGYLNDPLGSSFGRSFRDEFTVLADDLGEPMDALTLSRVAVYPIDARGLETPMQYAAGNNGRISNGAAMRIEARQNFQHMDLDDIAEQTGGKAYYNTNGLKQVIAGIVNNGSNYYTLSYATTNTTWNGQFRHIKVTVGRSGLQTQYRHGYYAIDRAKAEQRLLAGLQKKQAREAGNPFPANDAASPGSAEEPAPTPPAAPATSAASAATAVPADTGALIKHPKGGFEATMELGAIPPTELIFTASLSMSDTVEKLDKKAPLPADNYLEAEYKGKPFRTYTVEIHADAHKLRLAQTEDGRRKGNVEFVTLVYDQTGRRVNSLLTTAELDVSEEHYRELLASGLTAKQEIAVPVKGNYFLRVGVHDVASDRIGALEIPVDEVHAGVAGQGQM